jgi:hypothetical protein
MTKLLEVAAGARSEANRSLASNNLRDPLPRADKEPLDLGMRRQRVPASNLVGR